MHSLHEILYLYFKDVHIRQKKYFNQTYAKTCCYLLSTQIGLNNFKKEFIELLNLYSLNFRKAF